jgi:hypothetical protein
VSRFKQNTMRLPPEPVCRLSGFSQPVIVKERKPRRSSMTPSPAAAQPQGLPAGNSMPPSWLRRAVPWTLSVGESPFENPARTIGLS